MIRRTTPSKPYPDFPLTAHPNGQWCKKIRGKIHYFGPWDDWEGSLAEYQEERDDLYAGRKPRKKTDGVTLEDVLNRFLYSKKVFVKRCQRFCGVEGRQSRWSMNWIIAIWIMASLFSTSSS